MRPKPTRKDIRESIQSKPTTNDIRKITPSEDVERENNNPVQPPKDSYDKALDFITRFRKSNWSNSYLYEEKFTTPISTKEWLKLSGELKLSESDDLYPRYTFNSATSTLIIQCMPTAIHESIQGSFTKAITKAEADLPLPAQCDFVTGQKMTKFGGEYLGSAKIADLAVQITNAKDQMETKMIVEIGFSEAYEDLIKDTKLWLEGMRSVSLCMLVSFEEKPHYRCPVDYNMDEKKFKKLGFRNPEELDPEHFHLKGTFGPAIYKRLDDEPDNEELDNEELGDEESDDEEPDNEELEWVGNISTAFLEPWKRDATTGKAKISGNRVDLLTASSIDFKRSDFLNSKRDDDRTISINCEWFRKFLARKIRELAADRCRDMLLDRMEKKGGLGDKDYTPPEEQEWTSEDDME